MKHALILLILSLVTVANCASQVIPQNGLKAYYPFNGNANDVSGNGYNLTVNGAVLCQDRFGRVNKAYLYDGLNDYLAYGAPIPIDTSFSVSVWFATVDSAQRGTIFHNGIGNTNGFGIVQTAGISGTSNTLPGNKMVLYAGGYGYFAQATTDTGNWHHLVLVVSGNTYSYYFDNMLQASGSWFAYAATTNFSLGINAANNSFPFKGKIDDFTLYNRALTLAEIDTLFHGCGQQISSQPTNQTVIGGATALFTVSTNSNSQTNYQWQMDGGTGFVNLSNAGPFSGVNSDTLIITNTTSGLNNNDFRVILTNDIGCKDTSASAKLMVTPNSINDIESGRVSVYPNPSRGTFVVRTNNLSPGESYTAKISNILGQQISVATLQASSIEQVFNLATPGIYFLEIVDKKHSVVSRQKIMVN